MLPKRRASKAQSNTGQPVRQSVFVNMRFGTSVPRNRATAVEPGSSLNNFFSSSGLFARGIKVRPCPDSRVLTNTGLTMKCQTCWLIKLTWRSLALISSYVIIPARCLRHCFINVTVLYNFVDFRSCVSQVFIISMFPSWVNTYSLLSKPSHMAPTQWANLMTKVRTPTRQTVGYNYDLQSFTTDNSSELHTC